MAYSGTLSPAENIKILLNKQARFPWGSEDTSIQLLSKAVYNLYDALAAETDIPSQTGNGGKLLTTDGTNASWASTLAALTVTTLASTTGNITTVNSTTGNITTLVSTTAGATTGNITTVNSTTGNITTLASTTASISGLLTLSSTSGTSAGGITFGTDYQLFRNAAGQGTFNSVGSDNFLFIRAAGTNVGSFQTNSGNFFMNAVAGGGGLIFRTNGSTTALTLDSSQNATFAGNTVAGQVRATSAFRGPNFNSGDNAATAFTVADVTGIVSLPYAGIAATSTDKLILSNATAATGGATVQMSPRLKFRGNAWDTSASQTVDFFIENLPTSAATPTGTLKFGYSLNGAAATYPMTLTSSGLLTTDGSILSTNGNIVCNSSQGFLFGSDRTRIYSAANGLLLLANTTGTDFTRFILGTNDASGVSWKKTSAEFEAMLGDGSAITFVKAKLRASNGTAGANFSGAVTNITVVDGVITAVS